MQELPEPRATFVLKRGAYDALGNQVSAAVPQLFRDCWPKEHRAIGWVWPSGSPIAIIR